MGTGVENRRNRRASIGPSQKGIERVAPSPGQGETGLGEWMWRKLQLTDCDYGKQPERKNTRLFRVSFMTRYNTTLGWTIIQIIHYRPWSYYPHAQRYCHAQQHSFTHQTQFPLLTMVPLLLLRRPRANRIASRESWSRVHNCPIRPWSAYRPPSTPEEIPEALK